MSPELTGRGRSEPPVELRKLQKVQEKRTGQVTTVVGKCDLSFKSGSLNLNLLMPLSHPWDFN